MATTLKLQNSVNWAQSFLSWRPLNIGVANEPALTSANIVLQTIIGPPFAWNWNRTSVAFLTVSQVQDYVQAVSDFGFIEKASYIKAATITNVALTSNVATYTAANAFAKGETITVTGTSVAAGVFNVANRVIVSASAAQFTIAITNANVASTPDSGTAVAGEIKEIVQVENIVSAGNEQGPFTFISALIDDNAGNITFRVLPIPNGVYQITVIYQKSIPALMTSMQSSWAPIPDRYSYVYQNGFLALMSAYANDARWGSFNQKFVGALLSAAEGLDEQQKNVFMVAWLQSMTQQQIAGLKTQQGAQARGV